MAADAAPLFEGLWNHNLAYCAEVLRSMPQPCGSALDVGCGNGVLVRALSARAGHVVGIDVDHSSIELARKESAHLDNVELVEADVMTAPLEPASFDLVVAVASLHHLPLEAALMKVTELLRPGGTLAVVGLANHSSIADLPYEVCGFVAHRVLRRRHGWWVHAAPMMDPTMTYGDVRDVARRVLPGCTFRRRVLFRYTLTWVRPA